ncbi:MAG: ceramidase domain-containing protein [Hyphomicrobiaceae bacterium]
MGWFEHVFNYCERGLDPSFWAEPFNAVSNGAFLVTAGAGALTLRRSRAPGREPGQGRAERLALWGLVGLVAVIGLGSFLFHTFATRWALIADVAPITVFMVVYLGYALRVFIGLGRWVTGLAVAAFLMVGSGASRLACAVHQAAPGASVAATEPCFNGSLGYVPALVAMVVVGMLAQRKREAAAGKLLAAAVVFVVSVVLRTIDRDVCEATWLLGQVRGTHALWHLLNAVTLWLLLSAAIMEGRQGRQR